MPDSSRDDGGAGPSSYAQVEALSAGRSRRATAGNRMRELLEQERERILAEGDEPSGSAKAKRKGGAEDEEDEDAIFNENVGEDDVDFEQREDVEDVVDSDFDLSSDQGGEDDEEEGERRLEEEEKAARKASRAAQKAKIGQVHVRRPATVKKPAKRIAFAAGLTDGEDAQQQRASKRRATMQVADAVQARLQEDEKRRAEISKTATPKPKKIRLSQADLIAEALEMEEQNRESLKAFFEREEERRERDRRKAKKRMDGPFLRWRSVAVDRTSGQQRHAIDVMDDRTGVSKPVQSLTLDPVFAAREAASRERRRAAVAVEEESTEGSRHETGGTPNNASGVQDAGSAHSKTATATATSDSITLIPTEDADRSTATDQDVVVEQDEVNTSIEAKADGRPSGEIQVKRDEPAVEAKAPDGPKQAEWEARAYVSLHNLPASTQWPVLFGHVLGTHVDWSRYAVVPARNRPLRPRQSVCPITGLPAVYRDSRTGIPFANLEAYASISRVLSGAYRWSGSGLGGEPSEWKNGTSSKSSDGAGSVDPLQLGCFFDLTDEPGANNVLSLAFQSTTPVEVDGKVAPRGTIYEYVPRGVLAPGDEKAVIAAAQALPAGTTRSGVRRSTAAGN